MVITILLAAKTRKKSIAVDDVRDTLLQRLRNYRNKIQTGRGLCYLRAVHTTFGVRFKTLLR